jgi:hypothetical protein
MASGKKKGARCPKWEFGQQGSILIPGIPIGKTIMSKNKTYVSFQKYRKFIPNKNGGECYPASCYVELVVAIAS